MDAYQNKMGNICAATVDAAQNILDETRNVVVGVTDLLKPDTNPASASPADVAENINKTKNTITNEAAP